jgi:hypothetical protein
MSCAGSPKRNIESDLNEYRTFFGIAYGSLRLKCNNSNKGTPRTYNMASVYTNHDAERNGRITSPGYTRIENDIPVVVVKTWQDMWKLVLSRLKNTTK